ncbi:MAG: HlyD family secretion protein, partial [Sphingomonas sp.]
MSDDTSREPAVDDEHRRKASDQSDRAVDSDKDKESEDQDDGDGEKKPSLFKKPLFWIILIVVVAAIAVG